MPIHSPWYCNVFLRRDLASSLVDEFYIWELLSENCPNTWIFIRYFNIFLWLSMLCRHSDLAVHYNNYTHFDSVKCSRLDFAMLRFHHSRGYQTSSSVKALPTVSLILERLFDLNLTPLLWDYNDINQLHILKYHICYWRLLNLYIWQGHFPLPWNRNLHFQLSTQHFYLDIQ